MRTITIAAAVLAIALAAGTAGAQTLIAGTPHDFTGGGVIGTPPGGGIVGGSTTGVSLGINEYCLPCHAPHNGGNTAANQYGPLWNHALSTTAGGGYVSFTQNNVNESNQTLVYGSNLPANSALCLGCHDGVTAVSSFNIANATQVITPALVGQPIGANLPGTPFFTSIFTGNLVYSGALAPTGDLSNTHPIKKYPNPPYSGYATENSTTTGGVTTVN